MARSPFDKLRALSRSKGDGVCRFDIDGCEMFGLGIFLQAGGEKIGLCYICTMQGNIGREYTSTSTTGHNSSFLMNIGILDIILAAAAVMAALAVAAICFLGLVVWLAGGKLVQRKDQRTV